jgi:hypothetical protein
MELNLPSGLTESTANTLAAAAYDVASLAVSTDNSVTQSALATSLQVVLTTVVGQFDPSDPSFLQNAIPALIALVGNSLQGTLTTKWQSVVLLVTADLALRVQPVSATKVNEAMVMAQTLILVASNQQVQQYLQEFFQVVETDAQSMWHRLLSWCSCTTSAAGQPTPAPAPVPTPIPAPAAPTAGLEETLHELRSQVEQIHSAAHELGSEVEAQSKQIKRVQEQPKMLKSKSKTEKTPLRQRLRAWWCSGCISASAQPIAAQVEEVLTEFHPEPALMGSVEEQK